MNDLNNLKVKIITGFRKDQCHTIDAEEAHKAYYLFLNPSERGVFNNGLAIRGEDVHQIEPDYQATMGWHADHNLDGDDWNQIELNGIDRKLRDVLANSKELAQLKIGLNMPLSEATKLLPNSNNILIS